MDRRFALLVNPASAGGKALRAAREAAAVLREAGATMHIIETTSAEHARERASAAAAAGETVVAVGGDGIVGALAGRVRGTGATLGIVPAGRGNDFARVLGVPFEPKDAARTLLEAPEREVDVAEVNGKPFVCIASLGFDSDANRIANEARLVKGNLVYLYAAVRALIAWKPAVFTVTIDGSETHEWRGFSVAVANSKAYGGGMFIAPQAVLDDGRLDVLMIDDYSKLRALRDFPKAFKGTHQSIPEVRWSSATRVEVSADRPFVVYADGDPIAELPVTVTVQRRVLRVIAPEQALGPARQI